MNKLMDFKTLYSTPVNDVLKGKPHGWLQFKGTNICMDFHCQCGAFHHIDGQFVYFLRCPECNTIYELNGHIELIARDAADFDPNDDTIKEPDTQVW